MKFKSKLSALLISTAMVLGLGATIGAVAGKDPVKASAATLTDTITVDDTKNAGTNKYAESTFTSSNGVSYVANNAKSDAQHGEVLQFRNKPTKGYSGLVSTNTIGYVSSVTFAWDKSTADGRTMDVYGAISAYTAPSDLYDTDKQGTMIGSAVYGTSTTVTFEPNTYTYIGFLSHSSAQYVSSVAITYTTASADVVLTTLDTPVLSESSVEIGFTITASATYAPADTTESINWSVTGTNVDAAQISNIAMASGTASITVTGVKAGSCTITATPTVTTSLSKTSAELTVTKPTLTALTMSQATGDISLGNTLQLSVTPTPSAAESAVTWSSSDTSVASIDANGLVTANSSKIGTATITATSTSIPSITATCSVKVVESKTYNLVTSVDQLTEGAKVVLAGLHESTYYAAKPYASSDNNVKATSATVVDSVITPAAEAAVYTVGVVTVDSVKYYTLNDGTGYLYAASTSSNYMKTEATVSVNSEFAISIVDGVFTIQATLSANRNLMRFNYNGGSPLFSCYADKGSTTTGVSPSLYIEPSGSDTAAAFATSFLSDFVCDATGETAPSTSMWTTFANRYASLASSEKTILTEAVSSESGTDIQKCVARYDYVVAKYGSTKYDNYMSRAVVQLSGYNPLSDNVNNDSYMALIVIIGLIGFTSVGAFFYVRKHKEQ